jgi:hypothetical protein
MLTHARPIGGTLDAHADRAGHTGEAAGSSAWLGMVPDDWFESLQVVPFWAIAELVRCKNCLDAWLDAGETSLALAPTAYDCLNHKLILPRLCSAYNVSKGHNGCNAYAFHLS